MKQAYNRIFLILLFIIGLLATFSYGSYLDQGSEQDILFSNIKEYMKHIPGESALEREFNVANIIEISNSIEKDHGIAAYYPVSLGVWYLNSHNAYMSNILWHLYTYIFIFCVGCRSLYHFANDIFRSKEVASFVTLIFFFTPRMFAECHYNNKDMILLALVFACVWGGWRLINKTSLGNVMFFAVSGAFAFNTKIIGAWFWGIIGIYVLLNYIISKRFTKDVFIKMCLCIFSWLGVWVLITPACWPDITGFLKYLFIYAVNFERWISYILYQGKMLHTEYTGIPHKYLPTMILLTVPVGILVMIFIGGVWLVVSMFKRRQVCSIEGYVFTVVIGGVIPLTYAILAKTPVYNGWRHFYFVYVSMIVCVGYCAHSLEQYIKKPLFRKIMCGSGIAYVALLAVLIGVNHPQEHSYYNWLAGDNLETVYELDYWDMSIRQAYDIIEECSDEEQLITVSALSVPTMWGVEGNWKILPSDQKEKLKLVEDWEEASYIIVNTTYANMYSQEEYRKIREEYIMVDDIVSYGNTICEVYMHK